MCSLDIIKQMNEISSKIMNLSKSRMAAEMSITLGQLRTVQESKEVKSSEQITEQEKAAIYDTYRSILSLVLMGMDDSISKSILYFSSLQKIIADHPLFKKKPMDEKTKDLYDRTYALLRNRNSLDVSNALISCTETIFD